MSPDSVLPNIGLIINGFTVISGFVAAFGSVYSAMVSKNNQKMAHEFA